MPEPQPLAKGRSLLSNGKYKGVAQPIIIPALQ